MRRGHVYVVSEPLDRVDLRRYLADAGGRLRWREAVRIPSGIVNGLAYLHSPTPAAVLHQDVKPANVNIAGGVPKPLDFGVALRLLPAGRRP